MRQRSASCESSVRLDSNGRPATSRAAIRSRPLYFAIRIAVQSDSIGSVVGRVRRIARELLAPVGMPQQEPREKVARAEQARKHRHSREVERAAARVAIAARELLEALRAVAGTRRQQQLGKPARARRGEIGILRCSHEPLGGDVRLDRAERLERSRRYRAALDAGDQRFDERVHSPATAARPLRFSSGGRVKRTPSSTIARDSTRAPPSAFRRSVTASTRNSGVDAPAVTPTRRTPASQAGSMLAASSIRRARAPRAAADLDQAIGVAGARRADDEHELDSARASAFTAFWRFCVA